MSDETQVIESQEPQQVAEATPDTTTTAEVVESPVTGEGEQPETTEKPKTFTQEEVDALIGKRLSREERKWRKELERIEATIQKPQEIKPEEPPSKPKPDQFQTTEDYVEAVAAWKADEILRQRIESAQKASVEQRQKQYQEQVLTTFREREQAAKEKYADFEDVAYNPSVPITQAMAATIQESDLGPELAYFLGKNPKEADRIARLSPFLQAKELGKIEVKIASTPSAPKPSSAPAPINPISRPGASQGFVDTTDPKSLEKLGTSAWIEAERQRQMREWQKRQS